jgi:hypothetical protein
MEYLVKFFLNIIVQTPNANMPRPTKLTGEERDAALKSVPEWTSATSKDGIERKFSFKDFNGMRLSLQQFELIVLRGLEFYEQNCCCCRQGM